MAQKTKTVFFCKECGQESPKWLGKCPSCNQWNTFTEEKVVKSSKGIGRLIESESTSPQKITEISLENHVRIVTPINELNRILGGGIVPGSIVLLGGEPGIGKSTLALQLALELSEKKVLYVSGEESLQQVKQRAQRISTPHENCYLLSETSLRNIERSIKDLKPEFVVVDSIQTINDEELDSTAGGVAQIKECTARLLKIAKTDAIPMFLIGHINKDGNLAGPKVLEHIVDTVLNFEGDHHHTYRILRAYKNRFGATSEIGIFEMKNDGIKEVSNPSEILINSVTDELSGVSVACSIDGIRPFLIEIQALVSSAVYGTPQRTTTGYDVRRLNMLLAVLEKRVGFKLSLKDVFLNLAGGIKINDPAVDLAVVTAILSSNLDIAVDKNISFAGEIGLSGEIRPVNRIEQRVAEAEKLGFKKIFISEYSNLTDKFSIEIVKVSKVNALLKLLFANKA
ncbi:DNA repair protein RadA [Bacteroidales bacterium]|nr:DNA repair protein RadA [Bacteroidales bacterium]